MVSMWCRGDSPSKNMTGPLLHNSRMCQPYHLSVSGGENRRANGIVLYLFILTCILPFLPYGVPFWRIVPETKGEALPPWQRLASSKARWSGKGVGRKGSGS